MIDDVLACVRDTKLRLMVVLVGLLAAAVPTVLVQSWQPTPATADACFMPSPTSQTPNPTPSCPPPPRQPPAPDPALHVSNADAGRTVRLTAAQQLVISLVPNRAGDVWQGPDRSVDWLALSQLSIDSSGTTATLDATGVPAVDQNPQPTSHGPITVQAVTDTRCVHTQPACDYTPETWSITVYIDVSANPAASRYESCQDRSDTPTAGIELANYAGGSVAVALGDPVNADIPCRATDVTVPRAGVQLFRQQAVLVPGGARSGHFAALATGDTTVSFERDPRCAHEDRGEPTCSAVYSTALTPTSVGVHIAGPDAACVSQLTTSTGQAVYGARIGVTGSATAGASVAIWFRRGDTDAFMQRRSVVAGADGSFATSYVADGDYFLYATTGRCTTAVATTTVTPTISGPAFVRRGSIVTLTVRAPGPHGDVAVAFRRAGSTVFSTRRWGFTDSRGIWTTTFRADADYRYYARYIRYYAPSAGSAYTSWTRRDSAPGLTHVR